MEENSIRQYKATFDAIDRLIESDDGKEKVEVWLARELQPVLGYSRWENFQVAIHRALESCKSQEGSTEDHFCEVTKMVDLQWLVMRSRLSSPQKPPKKKKQQHNSKISRI